MDIDLTEVRLLIHHVDEELGIIFSVIRPFRDTNLDVKSLPRHGDEHDSKRKAATSD